MKTKKIEFYNYSIILVSIFPLLGLKKSAFTIIIFTFFSIVVFFQEKNYKQINKTNFLNFLVLSSYFLAYLMAFFLSEDKIIFKKVLIQNLSFFIFPFFLIFNRKSIYKKTLKNSLLAFVLSNIILTLIIWFKIVVVGFNKILLLDNYYNPLFRNIFSNTSEIHLPYLGMLFVFSSLIILNNMINNNSKKYSILIQSIAIFILISSIFLFASRIAILLFFVLSTLLILKKFSIKKNIVFLLILMLSLIPLFFIPTIKNRILDLNKTELILPNKNQTSAEVNFRFGIYNCVWKLSKENYLFGVGPENLQKELNNCYSSYTYRNYDDFIKKTYNTHCQYFDCLLKYGVFGLIVFSIYLFWGLNNKNNYYRAFIIIVLFSMITENILNRQIGIVFFNFFNTLFFVIYINEKEELNESLNPKQS